MERRAANTLRIFGIVATVIFVIAGCCLLLWIASFVVIRGGLTQTAMLLYPRALDSFVGAILAAIALITTGVLITRRLAREIGRNRSQMVSAISAPSPTPSSLSFRSPAGPFVSPRLSHLGQKNIHRLVLALGVQIAANVAANIVNLRHFASLPFMPSTWLWLMQARFCLSQAPHAVLIYLLLKRLGRRTLTFLIALFAFSILDPIVHPLARLYYRQIYTSHSVGLVWLLFQALIYVVILLLAYKAIRQMGLWPKASSVILATVAMFFYFVIVRNITATSVPSADAHSAQTLAIGSAL